MPIEVRHDLSGAGIEGARQAGRAEALMQARQMDIRQMAAQADQMNAMARNSAAQQQASDSADDRTNRSLIAGGEIAARYDLHALDQAAQAQRDDRLHGFELQRDEMRMQRAADHDARTFEQQRQMRLLHEGVPLAPGEERRRMVLQSSMDQLDERVKNNRITEQEAEPLRLRIDSELNLLNNRREAARRRAQADAQNARLQDFESRRRTWIDDNGETVNGFLDHNNEPRPMPSNRPVMSAADFARIRNDIATRLTPLTGGPADPEAVQREMQSFMNDWNNFTRPGRRNGGTTNGGSQQEVGSMIGQILNEMNAPPPGDIATAGQTVRAGLAANQQARPILQSMQQIINNPNPTPEQWMELRNLGLSLPPALRQRIGIPDLPPATPGWSNWGDDEPRPQVPNYGQPGAGGGVAGGIAGAGDFERRSAFQRSQQEMERPTEGGTGQPQWNSARQLLLREQSQYARDIIAIMDSVGPGASPTRNQARDIRILQANLGEPQQAAIDAWLGSGRPEPPAYHPSPPAFRGINENYLNQPGENQTSPTHAAFVMRTIDAALSSAQQASGVDREQLRELRRVVPYWGPIIDPQGARIMRDTILSRMEDRDLAARLERLLLRSQ